MRSVIPGVFQQPAVAQDKEKSEKQRNKTASDDTEIQKKVSAHWLKVADDLAKEYVISPSKQQDSPFNLHEKPVFRHLQTVREDDIGSVYIWKEASGRPAVVGVIFAWSNGRNRWVNHEFHSVSRNGVKLNLPGKSSWTTEQPGLEWKPIPDDLKPDLNARKRISQSRSLSRRFAANTTNKANSRWELRLVPNPIYEYELPDENVVYGGIFSMCQGTDTERLVNIEARNENDSLTWNYALASFTDLKLSVSIDEKQVWESPDGNFGTDGKPHFYGLVKQLPKPGFEVGR